MRILIVEDELIVADNLRVILERNGYSISGIARAVVEAKEIIRNEKPDLVLLDIYLKGDLSGVDLAIELNEQNIPFVYISANSSQEVLEAAKATGPYGFIVKPFRENDLMVSLEIAFYRHEYHQQTKSMPYYATSISSEVAGFIGNSLAMKRVFEMVERVASAETSVLILGESGTGKEGIAGYIHKLSSRKDKPFIIINCAALPEHLIESELFGHEKGAFTGAFEKKIGKFEQAAGGTIFLDEIGEMPPDLQMKLLRVLQEKEIERIGGNGRFKVNVRIIAATNRVLEKEIAEGRFRQDLYYRLYVFPIILPALRDRPEDIPLLVTHFIKQYAQEAKKNVHNISAPALAKLIHYAWPGNVRELQNVIERHVLLTSGTTISDVVLPDKKVVEEPVKKILKTMDELERDHILDVLSHCNYRVSGPGSAAEILNIPSGTLSYKMKKLGILKIHTVSDNL